MAAQTEVETAIGTFATFLHKSVQSLVGLQKTALEALSTQSSNLTEMVRRPLNSESTAAQMINIAE
jgi:hypothetical protein